MKLATILLILSFIIPAYASQRITTSEAGDILKFVSEKKGTSDAAQILMVYDFDNTLMAMNQDLGSDQWYNWQSDLIKQSKFKDAVAKTRGELFDIHYKIFSLSRMHLVQPEIPQIVKDIQNMKIKSLILTSRGPGLRYDLELEMDETGMNFRDSSIGPVGGYPGSFLPEGIESPREISFADGIVMGSGQNKGKILKAILKKTDTKFKTIIFLDDTLKNIENMENELKDQVDLYTFYYTHEEANVKRFEKDKTQAIKQWKKIKPAIESFR